MIKQADKKVHNKQEEVTTLKKEYVFAVGRRKEAVARVRLYEKDSIVWEGAEVKKGEIMVNKKRAYEYFGKEAEKTCFQPLIRTNTDKKFAITALVAGGGKSGQLGAVVLGIARALDVFDKERFHPILKKKGMLTRDPRVRERRKVGMGGKSRRRKQSPKR